jgi:hypothetical protein
MIIQFWRPAVLTAVAVYAAGLTGCGGLPLQWDVFQPSDISTKWANSADHGGVCPGLQSSGTGSALLPPDPGTFLIGFDYSYDPGAQPFPCWHYVDNVYRGAVRFDLTQIPDKFLIARVRLDMQNSDQGSAGVPIDGYITGMFEAGPSWWNGLTGASSTMANGVTTWEIPVTGFAPEGLPIIVPFPATTTGSFPKSGPQVMQEGLTPGHGQSLLIDVTDLAKQWKAKANFGGLAFVGTNETLPGKGVDQQHWVKFKATLEIYHNPNVP